MLMLIIVIFISIFIIYSSFMVISMERLPIIGTFKSIGATKKMTDLLLLGESLVYGIVGGITGCILGFGILYIMMNVMSTNAFTGTKMEVEMVYSMWYLISAFGGAVILSFISSLIPIIKVSKIPVKDIVLNNIQRKTKNGILRPIIGLILLTLSITLPIYVPKNIGIIIDSLCILSVGLSIILLIPYITKIFILLFERIYIFIFGNIGILAAKNLRDNKSIINNISLLTIGIASILMINTVSFSVSKEIINIYDDLNYEIMFIQSKLDRTIEQRLRAINGVSSIFGVYEARDIKILEKEDRIWSLFGISSKEYFDYCDFNLLGDMDKLMDKLDDGRNIILSTILKDKFSLKKGDIITLDMKRGDKPYKVIGFVNTIMRTGNVSYVSDRYLKRDMEIKYYQDIYVKTNKKPKRIKSDIKDKFRGKNNEVIIMDELQRKEEKNNAQIFILLKGFSVLAMIIGVFGILNNFIVSFISRKRSIAIYKSIGMNKLQSIKMLFIEAITGGLIGGVVGCIGGWLFIFIVEYILKALNLAIPMHFSWDMFVKALIGCVIISVIASISPALKSSKLNIIESIKYE
ncbi:MAG: FtsX-like permease family protein [Firmicutes bacterium]|nr:FtsX-like permease family protein [Bacillota bacterium]